MTAGRFTITTLIVSLLLAVASAWVFLSDPRLDLVIENYFYDADSGFIFRSNPFVNFLRRTVIIAYAIWYVSIVLFVLDAFKQPDRPIWVKSGIGAPQWLYVVICSLVGPLLVANIILKNNWGRARPRQIEEFGGSSEFSPPLLFSDQCATNCSFVSGEPASMFMIFFSLAFILPARRAQLMAIGILAGTASGLMRMGQGGHFFSDVIFAGIFMAMCAAAIYWAMFLAPWAGKTDKFTANRK